MCALVEPHFWAVACPKAGILEDGQGSTIMQLGSMAFARRNIDVGILLGDPEFKFWKRRYHLKGWEPKSANARDRLCILVT